MFTGIIEEIGTIQSARNSGKGKVLVIRTLKKFLDDVRIDDSISVSGTCLTVIRRTQYAFMVEAVEETLKKTTTGSLRIGNKVNLEKAMKMSDRLGGHLVLGHVDTVGKIINIDPQTLSWMFEVEFPPEHMKYVIPVGSIAFDGISLTVAERRKSSVVVAIIPHTMEKTIFGIKKKGDLVNIEFDLIGKYIEQFLPKE
jgi:riboflavin synthase